MSSQVQRPASQSTASDYEGAVATKPRERAQTEESELSLSAGDIQWTKWAPSQKRQDATAPEPTRSISLRLSQAEVQGLDHKGRPSLDPASFWHLSASFTPTSNTGFLKLRFDTTLQSAPNNETQHLYIFIPPERISSISVNAGPSSSVVLRLVLEQQGDVIGPTQLTNPKIGMEADKQLLDRAQWLATQPALDIKVFHSRVTLDRWQPFCDACTNGSLQSDADHADLAQLYGRRGGHVLNPNYDTDTPPAYEDTDGPPADVPQPSRKRQRASPVLTSQVMGKEFELFIRTICTKIVAQQRDAMIAPLLARMKEMEDLITDNVMANIEGVLQKRLVEMREELQDGLDESLDRRVDALKEEIGDHVKEEVKEQVGEEIGRVEEDLVETVMDRMA